MKPFELIAAECDADIRAGKSAEAAKRLQQLNSSKVPREWRLPLANLSRRAGLLNLGMRLLTPIVHPDRARAGVFATSAEIAEYGVLLHRLGATREALQMLDKVDTLLVPDALLYRSFCHFSEWEFAGATRALETFLAQGKATSYMQFVASVNLASAYIGEAKFAQALELLERNIDEARINNYSRLQGNCHELRAQIRLHQGDYAQARVELSAANELLGGNLTFDQLFVKKWTAIARGLETRDVQPILEFRREALERGDWESVREADRFALKVEFDESRFMHLMFGTPFEGYRDLICKELGRSIERETYLHGDAAAPRMDVATGHVNGGAQIAIGTKCHQLIEVLLRDLYRPQRLGAIFAELCPGEHFDLFSSPDRVHQLLRRTRRWIEAEALPIQIREKKGFYSLIMTGPFAFSVPLRRQSVDTMSRHFQQLHAHFKTSQIFTARQARVAIALPRSSFQLFINWAIENGHVEKFGSNRETCYRISSNDEASIRAA